MADELKPLKYEAVTNYIRYERVTGYIPAKDTNYFIGYTTDSTNWPTAIIHSNNSFSDMGPRDKRSLCAQDLRSAQSAGRNQ
jgi:hypothetical protein